MAGLFSFTLKIISLSFGGYICICYICIMTRGQKIRIACVEQGITQQQLAEKIGRKRITVSRAVNDRDVSQDVLNDIEKQLKIKL